MAMWVYFLKIGYRVAENRVLCLKNECSSARSIQHPKENFHHFKWKETENFSSSLKPRGEARASAALFSG